MFGSKAKIAFFCILGLLILLHWSEAGKYDDGSESEEEYPDVRRLERNADDLVNEDASSAQATVPGIRMKYVKMRRYPHRRSKRVAVDRGSTVAQRHSRRRRWRRW